MKDLDFLNRIKREIKNSYTIRYVAEEDVKNKELKDLPIRVGCFAIGGCACLGTCREIIGTIPRNEYEQTINCEKTIPINEFNKQVEEKYYKYRKE